MDKKLSRAVDVLDALDSYFQNLEVYIKQADPEKFSQLDHAITLCRDYKKKFDGLKLDDSGLFHAVHLHAQMQKTLKVLYDQLNFKIPVGEEISKTRAYRMTEVFNKITTIYRTYIRDVAAESTEIIDAAVGELKTTDPVEMQRYWREFPGSIEFYLVVQTKALDKSYRERDVAARQRIFELIEQDKQFILNEKSMISPFLTFNCVPWRGTKQAVAWSEISKIIGRDVTATKIEGAIIVSRVQDASVTHMLPTALAWGAGIVETDVQGTLMPLSGGAWQWKISIHDTAKTEKYYIFEQLGDDEWRILVPWMYDHVDVPRDLLVHKIKTAAFGRPDSYHSQLDSALRQALSKRVSVISLEAARPYDVSLSVMRVTHELMEHIKSKRGDVIARLDDPALDNIFEKKVLEELGEHELKLLDAVVYWVDWSRQNFRRDLDARAAKLPKTEWSTEMEIEVERCVHYAVDVQLRKSSNVFQDLFDKHHKINEVATHTRRT